MTDAARELRFSPAAVSQHISALERQVGAPLFVRHPRGVRPTAAGSLLASYAQELVQRLLDAERDLADLLSSEGGTVRLGIFASATVGALPGALEKFTAQHPNVAVVLNECDVDIAAERVRTGSLDLAIVFDDPDYPTLDRSGLQLTPLGVDPVDIALCDAHPLAHLEQIALTQLRDEPWILARGDRCAELVRRRCRASGFEPRVALATDDHAAARSLASAGLGIAALPRLMGQQTGDGVIVRSVMPAPAREIYAAVAADGTGVPAGTHLRDAFAATSTLESSPSR